MAFTDEMRISQVSADHRNELWILLDDHLLRYNPRLDTYKKISVPGNASVSCFTISSRGSIWIATADGFLHHISEEEGIQVSFDLFAHSRQVNSRSITSLYVTKENDKLFIGTLTHGVKVFDITEGTYTDIFRYDEYGVEIAARDFIEVSSDKIWIATESGLFIYNIETDSYEQILSRPYDPYSLSTNSLFTFCMDREGGIWIGTYSGGMNYYPPYHLFTRYYTHPEKDGMKGNLVHDICTDQYGNLWIATEDAGVNKLDRKTGTYTNFQPQTGIPSISHTNIHGMVADGNKLWVGTLC